jgi:glycosyltransferase involved in cell wall biosynthesis
MPPAVDEHPSVSVIIPTYNAGALIAQTLDSVLAQTYQPHEIVVIDDGSTDDTGRVLGAYEGRLRILEQENAGVARARNRGIESATGDWLAFVDADDLWRTDKLEIQIRSLSNQRWSHTNSLYFGHNQDGRTSRSDLVPQYGGWVHDRLIVANFITTSTVLIEKSLFLEHGGFDESMEVLEDGKLWIQIAKTEPLHYEPRCLTSRLRSTALAESYQICSYIAEDARDFSFSAYCALRAVRNDLANPARWRRLARTALNASRLSRR